MLEIRVRKGLDIRVPGAPAQHIREGNPVRSVALLGIDTMGASLRFEVETGQRVRIGEPLFSDRRRAGICWTAPAAGVVSAIERGPRRALERLEISVEDDRFVQFGTPGDEAAAGAIRRLLLQSGLWVALRSRPFGYIPDPDSTPAAIFVTAMASDPLAADAAVVLAGLEDPFTRGLGALKQLTEGPVFVCQAPGTALAEADRQIRVVAFKGPHPAGLAGTHVHHLFPVSAERSVWQINYQEVVALGHLLQTGRLWTERVVSLAGSAVSEPSLLRTRPGARLDQLLEGELGAEPAPCMSGSILSGYIGSHLGRHHYQVTALASVRDSRRRGWRQRLLGWLPPAPPGPLIPLEAFERVMPLDILPTPLLRALSVGDVETASRLGCLELLEEDVALLSHLCVGRANYGALLRQTLDQLKADRG